MPTNTRFAPVDALRGLIMMIMAIDHASAFIARQHSSEFWNGAISIHTDAFAFLTRWITHLCAPGFFFLMGAGVYWFATSRADAGWTQPQIIRRMALRGGVYTLVGLVFEPCLIYMQSLLKPAAVKWSTVPMPMPNDGVAPIASFLTLAALGAVLVCCALLLWFRPIVWLATSAVCVLLTHTLLPASGQAGPVWFSILLAPALSQRIVATYPVIPWLAIASFGMYFGYYWKQKPIFRDRVWVLGLMLVLAACALRAGGGFGNIVAARDGSWIEFLNNVKYPPSLVYWTMSVGINLLLLTCLIKLPPRFTSHRSPLLVFGQTPLFYYLIHFCLLFLFAIALFPEAGSMGALYGVWVALLVVLYPLCVWYRSFKTQKPPESFWRLF